jgi:NACHT domain
MSERALVLAAAVVKTAVRLWAGGHPFGGELAGDLTGLIKGHVSGALDQRRVRRQFDQVEELVAGQILAVMSEDSRDLDEGERYAAVAAVTETISRARLTDRVLFGANLDPLYLERFFGRFIADETRDLSAVGLRLYDQVLARCSAYIIEIADKLPRFQGGAFTELLRRDTQIRKRLQEVLERLPAPVGDDSLPGRVEVAYRQRIAKQLDRLELFGPDFASQWYAPSIACVTLTATVAQPPAPPAVGLAPSRRRAETFEQWLAECPRLLIDGRAGGGKTTILQWLAVRAARRDFTGPAATLNGLVPFFIRLREHAGAQLPQPGQFLDKIAPLLAPEAGDWPRRQLFGGRAIVLVDGIDEVPEGQRRAVTQWLRDLTDFFPQSRYVVTTRPGALADGALAEAGFAQACLEPMSPPLVRTFIGQWHAAIGEWQADAEAVPQLPRYRDGLLRTLEDDRYLSELASTPLLAGLICALNQHLDGQLPRRRGEIFERALAMFHERDRKRGTGSAGLDLAATSHLLGDLALWMVRNAAIEVAEDTARGVLTRSSLSLPGARTREIDLYRHLMLGSGLLREPTAGHLGFVHRTFQEYLAAKALIAADNVGEIIRNAADDQWREVVILAAGQGNTRQATDLLRGLTRSAFRGQQRYRRRLAAVASLQEIPGADPAVLKAVDRGIRDLLPPRTLEQAEALSHARERLLPHLAERAAAVRSLPEVQATIRAASLIGGPGALDIVAVMAARLPRGTQVDPATDRVREELIRGWDYFPAAQYPERVLLRAGMTRIRADSPWKLAELAGLPGIRSVDLSGWVSEDSDLTALDGVAVPELRISRSAIRSLTGVIRPWPAVERVDLVGLPELADITALRCLPSLKALVIRECSDNRRYADVAATMNLRRFEVGSLDCPVGTAG